VETITLNNKGEMQNLVSVYGKITFEEKHKLLLKTGQKKVPDALAIAVKHYLNCNMEA
jgi:hypothetical protein